MCALLLLKRGTSGQLIVGFGPDCKSEERNLFEVFVRHLPRWLVAPPKLGGQSLRVGSKDPLIPLEEGFFLFTGKVSLLIVTSLYHARSISSCACTEEPNL